ncbi:hypothetical protein I5535_14040 [Rhodobacteraceae bacterium F11138]|nr:hypothetical protein [Rhodobacteraceae bacterium F11138]
MNYAIAICNILAVFFFADNCAVAQTLKLVDEQLEEHLDKNSTTISGAVLVGVQRGGGQIERFDLSARLPDGFRDQVCLKLVSANGRYSVRESYLYDNPDDTGPSPGEPVGFQYSTKHADYLKAQGAHGVAALVTSGACDSDHGTPTVAIWDDRTDAAIELLINSFDADKVFAYVGDSSDSIACDRVRAESLSAYDTVCEIEKEDLLGRVKIEIYRYMNRKAAEPDEFRLELVGK